MDEIVAELLAIYNRPSIIYLWLSMDINLIPLREGIAQNDGISEQGAVERENCIVNNFIICGVQQTGSLLCSQGEWDGREVEFIQNFSRKD